MGTDGFFKKPLTAQEAVTRELRRAIAVSDLKPGQRIHQEELAKKLGVSRVPIREALRGLEAEGQVTGRPNRGYYVTELTFPDLEEIYLLRDLVENEMNRRAAANMDEEITARLEQLIEEMDEAASRHDVRKFATLNKDFHFTIFEQAELPRFSRTADLLWQSSATYRSVYLNDREELRRLGEEHRVILQACKNRDAKGLVEITSLHRRQVVHKLRSLLNENGSTA